MVTATLEPGQRLRLVKFVAYGWSGSRSLPAVRDQADAALAAARQDRLGAVCWPSSGPTWTSSGTGPTFELDGDAEIQQAVRFALFHVLQAGARAEGRAIAAKGLTGPGYDGHCFWDTETFVLPVLTYTAPDAAAHALRWRHSTLPLARRARRAARAARRRVPVAHDPRRGMLRLLAGRHRRLPHQRRHRRRGHPLRQRHRRPGLRTRRSACELLAETARLWRSLGHHDAQGRFRIDGVTGPDEYSAIADNNVYTNLMAQQNLSRRRRRGGNGTPSRPGS